MIEVLFGESETPAGLCESPIFNKLIIVCSPIPLGVGDGRYAKRINKKIEDRALIVVQKMKEPYSQVLKIQEQ